MKFLIIGLGSMGKRRVRNLRRLGVTDIVGYDPRQDRREEAHATYGIETIKEWDNARTRQTDGWIISTPPDLHFRYALDACDRSTGFFMEAGMPDPLSGELQRRTTNTGVVCAPSCTMRFFPGPRRIKQFIDTGEAGRALTFTYQSGQYLPDWHPWESYKDFYVGRRETGACREIVPFELNWLTDAFGPVERLTCLKGKVSDLDVDIDDVYHVLGQFGHRTIGHLMVDVVARPAVRYFRAVCADGTIEWDHGANIVRTWTVETEAWMEHDVSLGPPAEGYLHSETPYEDEMACFLSALRGETAWPFPLVEERAVIDLLLRAEACDATGTPR